MKINKLYDARSAICRRANVAVKWTAIIAAVVLAGCIIAVLVIRHVI